MHENIKETDECLVIGLGNIKSTPDSLGPKVIDKVIVTRHLFELDNNSIDKGISNICALSPGVMGTTGIETCDIIKALVEKIEIDYDLKNLCFSNINLNIYHNNHQ